MHFHSFIKNLLEMYIKGTIVYQTLVIPYTSWKKSFQKCNQAQSLFVEL